MHRSARRAHSDLTPLLADPGVKKVEVVFREASGRQHHVQAPLGSDLLDVAWHYKVPLEGACEGSVACSTCHVILPSQIYSSLDEPSETEEDCLDLAPGLSETSRLGCQVRVHDGFEGAVIDLPAVTVNFYVDGFVPNQH
jgi:ferredoxin